MSRSKSQFAKTSMGVLAVVVLLALSACTPSEPPEPSPTSAPSESPAPEPYAGPILSIGDELNRFLLTAGEIEALLPGVSDVTAPSPSLRQISDGGGAPFIPAICGALYVEQSLGKVGARTVSWTVADAPEHGIGRLNVLQFADEAQVQTRMDQLIAASEQCSEFDYGGTSTFTGVVEDSDDGVRALVGTLASEVPQPQGWRAFHGFAAAGNVLVELSQPFTGDQKFDADAVATALVDRSVEARSALIDQLTQTPPTDDEPQPQDGGTAWSDWLITSAGIGPILLGTTVAEAGAAASGAQAGDPEYPGGPVPLRSPDGSASLLLSHLEDTDIVTTILIGSERPSDSGGPAGAALPSVDGVRVGSTASDAMTSYPAGTHVWVISAAISKYEIADRDGRLITFFLDTEDPMTATIVGIAVEDATKRRPLSFG